MSLAATRACIGDPLKRDTGNFQGEVQPSDEESCVWMGAGWLITGAGTLHAWLYLVTVYSEED